MRDSTPASFAASPPERSKTPWRSRLRALALGLAAIAGLVLIARTGGEALPAAAEWVQGLGYWGPAAFIALYALATVLFVPGSLLTLAGGALFGVLAGVTYVFAAAVLGSSLAFGIARYGARGWVEQRIATNPRFAALDRAVGGEGLKITFLLRLSPAFPFSFLNYALGLTRVRLGDYLLASVGMLPATFLYVYSGRVIGDVAQLAAGVNVERGGGYFLVLALGLAATVAVTILVTRTARRALAETTELNETAPGEGE